MSFLRTWEGSLGNSAERPVRTGRPGRPVNGPSIALRSAAWLRHLLERLDDVKRWALWSLGDAAQGNAPSTPPPPAWTSRRFQDGNTLRELFGGPHAPAIPTKESERSPLLLDAIFGPLLSGTSGGSGRYFSDRVRRAVVRPDDARIAWLDELVPGSAAAFYQPPSGIDAWFYDALDFSSPWFAHLCLWRSGDPGLHDPGWEDLTAPEPDVHGRTILSLDVLSRRNQEFDVYEEGLDVLASGIEAAMIYAMRPELIGIANDEFDETRQWLLDAAASSSKSAVTQRVEAAVTRQAPSTRWLSLTHALMAHRLANRIHWHSQLTAWWLDGTLQAMENNIDDAQSRSFCSSPNAATTLRGAIAEARSV